MKVKKSSWHYRLLDWEGMYPENMKTTNQYCGILALLIIHIIFGGFIYLPIKYLIGKYHSKPLEIIDDTKNNKKENIQ